MRTERFCTSVLTFALICLVANASRASAQTATHAPSSLRSFGLKGGVNVATITPTVQDSTSLTPGFMAGIFYTPSPNTYTWQLEGVVQRQGTAIGGGHIHLTYISVPFLFRLNFRQNRSTFFYAVAGGSAGYLLSGTLDLNGDSTDLSNLIDRSTADAIVGVGCDIKRRFSIEVRWAEGLTKNGIVIVDTDTRNRAITVSFGFRLRG